MFSKSSAHTCAFQQAKHKTLQSSHISTGYRFENLKVLLFRYTERHTEYFLVVHIMSECILKLGCLCYNWMSLYIIKLQVTIFRLYLFFPRHTCTVFLILCEGPGYSGEYNSVKNNELINVDFPSPDSPRRKQHSFSKTRIHKYKYKHLDLHFKSSLNIVPENMYCTLRL